jgi:hypothetical protein
LSISKYDSLGKQWNSLPVKSSLVKGAAVRVGRQKMWVVGGKSKGQRLASITEVDLSTGLQTLLPVTLSKQKSGVGAVYLDGKAPVTQASSTSLEGIPVMRCWQTWTL